MVDPSIESDTGRFCTSHALFEDSGLSEFAISSRIDVGGGSLCFDPIQLFAIARHDPLQAVRECQKNLSILERGYQKQRRKYIAITYANAFFIGENEENLTAFNQYLADQHVVKLSNVDRTRERLIYLVFEVVFARTGAASSNTAYRYAYGLDHYLASRLAPEKVANILIERGPEKLYKEAVRSNRADNDVAHLVHQRHLNKAKIDGRYAAALLAREHEYKQISSVDNGSVEPKTDDVAVFGNDDLLSDDDDYDHNTEIDQKIAKIEVKFDKMVVLAAQLVAAIAEERSTFSGDDDSDLVPPDADDVDNENEDSEVMAHYDSLLTKSSMISKALIDLKNLLQSRVRT